MFFFNLHLKRCYYLNKLLFSIYLHFNCDFYAFFMNCTAARIWCLARMLPLIIGNLLSHDEDANWNTYIRLLNIEEIVFPPTSNSQLAAYLAVLVEEYLETFSQLYDRDLIPKQHYMVHYPRQIMR